MKIFLRELLLSIRVSRKNLLFVAFNIGGLTLGIAGFVLIILFLNREDAYDKTHTRYKDIYRMNVLVKRERSETNFALAPAVWPSIIKDQNREIENYVRMLTWNHLSLSSATTDFKTYVDPFMFADSTFFKIFDGYQVISGDANQALVDPFSIAISKSTAKSFFGSKNPIGETLLLENKYEFKVTAVFADVDFPTHLNFKLLASFESLKYLVEDYPQLQILQRPGAITSPTYFLLTRDADYKELESRFPDFIENHVNKDRVGIINPYLEPLVNLHYGPSRDFELGEKGSVMISNVLFAVALLITVMALVNFVFMMLSNLMSRMAELNISKVYGMNNFHLLIKVLSVPFTSIVVSGILAFIIIAFGNESVMLMEARIIYSLGEVVYPLIAVCVILTLLATAVPSIWLVKSGLNMEVLKSRSKLSLNRFNFFRIFIVTEFSITVALIFGVLIVYDQVSFLKNKEIGYKKTGLLVLPIPKESLKYAATLRDNFDKIASIDRVSFISDYPGEELFRFRVRPEGIEEELTTMAGVATDYNYINAMGLRLIEGRGFEDNPSDSMDAVIINESAVQQYGWSDPIGKKISFNKFSGGLKEGRVIGIVKNFNINSLKSAIEPLMLFIDPGSFKYIMIRFSGSHTDLVPTLSEIWKNSLPEIPFDYLLLDDALAGHYQNETNYFRALLFFSGIAISLACIGMLAISSLSVLQKMKEVAVKLMLGASKQEVIMKAFVQNLQFILISFLLGIPLSYWLLENWLSAFPYRVDIGIHSIMLSFIIAFVVSMLSLSYTIFRIVKQNPITTLRNM